MGAAAAWRWPAPAVTVGMNTRMGGTCRKIRAPVQRSEPAGKFADGAAGVLEMLRPVGVRMWLRLKAAVFRGVHLDTVVKRKGVTVPRPAESESELLP